MKRRRLGSRSSWRFPASAPTIRALALLAEIVYGAPASTRGPARFSFAHGGKDGHPFPVDQLTYDASIDWLAAPSATS